MISKHDGLKPLPTIAQMPCGEYDKAYGDAIIDYAKPAYAEIELLKAENAEIQKQRDAWEKFAKDKESEENQTMLLLNKSNYENMKLQRQNESMKAVVEAAVRWNIIYIDTSKYAPKDFVCTELDLHECVTAHLAQNKKEG